MNNFVLVFFVFYSLVLTVLLVALYFKYKWAKDDFKVLDYAYSLYKYDTANNLNDSKSLLNFYKKKLDNKKETEKTYESTIKIQDKIIKNDEIQIKCNEDIIKKQEEQIKTLKKMLDNRNLVIDLLKEELGKNGSKDNL